MLGHCIVEGVRKQRLSWNRLPRNREGDFDPDGKNRSAEGSGRV